MTGEAVVDGRLPPPQTQKIYLVNAIGKIRFFLILFSRVFKELN